MATYYVRQDGNDANTGLGSTTNLAWKTLQKALGATGIGSGDTVYIAPGIYIEAVTIGGTYSAPTYVIGNPTASQFSGVSAGLVNHTGLNAAGTATTIVTTLLTGTSKSYLKFSYIYWSQNLIGGYAGTTGLVSISGRYNEFTNCVFEHMNAIYPSLTLTALSSQALDAVVSKCIFYRSATPITFAGGSNLPDTSSISSCLFFMQGFSVASIFSVQTKLYNCTSFANNQYSVVVYSGSATNQTSVFNSILPGTLYVDVSNSMIENYNRFVSGRQGTIAVGSNTTNAGALGLDIGQTLLFGIPNSQIHTSALVSPNQSYGITANAPDTDLYGISWSGTSPDAGSGTYRFIGGVSPYLPTERNASTITIAPGSTSQSIELYLGATGLTFATSGLAAYYVRNQAAPVAITLVTQTPTGAWTSGGFAEIDSATVPGVYRLDVPNAAFAAGASDVTIVVRGASGTNGAVLTVTLSSGGLTAAQTAAAVWGESPAGYNDGTTFGGVVNTIATVANDIETEVGDIPIQVWDELRTNHTTAGSFGQYVNAELVTPVTSAALVRMGPYEVRADGLGASDPLDIQKGAQHGVDIQCVDAFGSGIDITSATVTAKVYNSGATLVDTYACTATYAADGRATFTIDTTVTDTPGTYTATITRTTGASDTQIFGPLRIYVRDI
jgi:hypothetical protein